MVRCDRNNNFDSNSLKTKGGCAIIYPSHLCVTKVQAFSNGANENINIEISELNLAIIAIYRPPQANKHQTSTTIEHIDTFLASTNMSNIILGTDFNLPKDVVLWRKKDRTNPLCDTKPIILGPIEDDNESNDENFMQHKRQQAQMLFDLASAFGLKQFVNSATNGINILDLLYSNTALMSETVIVHSSPFSDHNVVTAKVYIESGTTKDEHKNKPMDPSIPNKISDLNLNDV